MRLANRKYGWIGVDVGTSSVKIAQVMRHKNTWSLAASAIIPRQQAWQDDLVKEGKSLSSSDELLAARSLQQGYNGRRVAAALPMMLCDIHRLDVDLAREANAMQLLQRTIQVATQKSVKGIQCDYWSAPAAGKQPAWSQALTVPEIWTEQICSDITEAGWSCKAIDGSPLAIARAAAMVHPQAKSAPIAVLDWGSSRATLCFVENGQPSYVRCLKGCALQDVLDLLVNELQVSELEAQSLLEDYGLTHSTAAESNEVVELVGKIIAEPISQLVEEIKRSFSHFQYLRRSNSPQFLCLQGGGGMIKQLDTHLASCLDIEVKNWQLPPGSTEQDSADPRSHCLLAPAIALSALAWEAS